MDIKNLISNKGNILDGVFIIEPKIFEDNRGFFYESWNQQLFNNTVGEEVNFQQDNHSLSNLGVLRGLHYQIEPKPQGKLVRCITGSVFDVAVDLRKSSPTFGEWASIVLDNVNKLMIWIPVGFAHGFLSLEDNSELLYKASELWSKDHDRSIRWDDENININWPLKDINFSEPRLSEKDATAPFLKNAEIFN
tara:strand:- start:2054 stop:2632 length:579 start_codon:yes stop_codon:yes gene_type:complete